MIFREMDVAACTDAPEATASIDEFLCHLLHGRNSISEDVSIRSALVDAVVCDHLLKPGHRHGAFRMQVSGILLPISHTGGKDKMIPSSSFTVA